MLRELIALTAISLSVCHSQAVEPGRVPNIIPKDLREYYPQLSDDEYASLRPKPAYFPLVVHTFLERPLMQPDIFATGARYGADISIKAQQYILDNSKNPKLYANTIAELAWGRNPKAIPMLLAKLPTLTDANLVVDCLNALRSLKAGVRGKDLQPYLKSDNPDVRLAVLKLYAIQKDAMAQKVLALTENESDVGVRLQGIGIAASCPNKGAFEIWTKYLKGSDDQAFTAALPALLSFPEANSALNDLLVWCGAEKPLAPMSLAMRCGGQLTRATSAKLLTALSKNANASVRSEVAIAIARLRLNELQDILLRLSTDTAEDVRQQAAGALAPYRDETTYHALMKLCGDAAGFKTRKLAREAVIAMAPAVQVAQLTRSYLDSPNELVRENAYHILYRLHDTNCGGALEARLASEKRPRNIAECIKALGAAKGLDAEMLILRHADHMSPVVRCAVATTIGAVNSRKGYSILEGYVRNEDVERKDVRRAALLAMARINDPSFAKSYLYVLKRVVPETKAKVKPLSADDRTVACWAAARLAQPDADLGRRLYEQVTKAVLPMDGSPPEFDTTEVRVSATLALCMWSLRTHDERSTQRAEFCMGALEISEGTGSKFPSSPSLRAFGKQVRYYYKGEDFPRQTTTPRPLIFSLEYLDKK